MTEKDGREGHGRSAVPRVAVVGAGAFGAEHAREFRAAGARVCAVVDPDAARAGTLAAEVGAEPFTDVAAMLTAHQPDGLSVAATAAAHPRLAAAAVEAGVKVLVEKPVARTAAEVRALRGLERADELVVPGHVLRFDAAHRALRAALPRIGAVHAIGAHRDRDSDHSRRFPHEHPALLTMVHDIDLCLWLTGASITTVGARGAGGRTASGCDVLLAHARTSTGVLCEVRSAWVLPAGSTERDRLEVFGADGVLVLDRHGETATVTTAVEGETTTRESFSFAPLAAEAAEATAWFAGGARPAVTLADAEHGLAVAEAVILSAAGDGRSVVLDDRP